MMKESNARRSFRNSLLPLFPTLIMATTVAAFGIVPPSMSPPLEVIIATTPSSRAGFWWSPKGSIHQNRFKVQRINLFSSLNDMHDGEAATADAGDPIPTFEIPTKNLMMVNFGVQVARQVHPSIVLVTPVGVRNTTTRGTGFVIDKNEVFKYVNETTIKAGNSVTDGGNESTIKNMDRNDQNDDIYIVTAAHVAAPGWDLQISLPSDGRNCNGNNVIRRKAMVVGRDIGLDLALLRVRCKDETESLDETNSSILSIKGLQLYRENDQNEDRQGIADNPSSPEVGTLVFAHGYPANRVIGPTMTMGIVCGVANGLGLPDRDNFNGDGSNGVNNDNIDEASRNTTSSSSTPFISKAETTIFVVTDAGMSGGMSGGPLTDIDGRVMGVNALIRPDLRALGNYAVSVMELRSFLAGVGEQLREQQQQQIEDEIDSSSGQSGASNTAGGDRTTTKSNGMMYQVVLFNDPFNKRERVSNILQTIAKLSDETSTAVMMEAHTRGRGVVQTFPTIEEARKLCQELRGQDVLVEVETTRTPNTEATEDSIATAA